MSIYLIWFCHQKMNLIEIINIISQLLKTLKMSSFKQGEWQCTQCNKKYTNYSSYYVHMRNKHKEELKQNPNFRIKFSEQQINDLQDKIYVFLGQLGDANPEQPERVQEQQSITQDPNRYAGQANYLINLIVRTPYENEISIQSEIPTPILSGEEQVQINKKISKQIVEFNQLLNKQKQKWQYFDPLDQDQDPQQEFSLMDIPKLFKNIQKRKIELKTPQISIFLLWLSRICKSDAWKFFYQLIVYCFMDYMNFLKEIDEPKCIQNWLEFIKKRKISSIENYRFENLSMNISTQNSDKMLQYYFKWVEFFGAIPSRAELQSKN